MGPKLQTEAALAWFLALTCGFFGIESKKTPAAVLQFVPPIGTYFYFKPYQSLRPRVKSGRWAALAGSEAGTATPWPLSLQESPASDQSNSYLPGRGDTMITKVVHPGRGSAIAPRLC
ncbi:hypothetical protein NQZ68_040760 [Dissostichus eleginoides]|nr:hypothetical protein NQZ68_040760 [Dissostichus eleginoides]